MLACSSLPSSLTSSVSSLSSPPSTSSTTSTAHPYHRYRSPGACSQREVSSHIFQHSPFTIASRTPMADQTQNQHATYPYMLDGTGLSINIDRSPQGLQNQDQTNSPGQVQNHAQMSPPSGAGAARSAFMYPFAHATQHSYAPLMHQGSPTPHMNQAQTLTLDPAQLRTPSVGPSRVLTRRQARMAAAHPYSNTSQDSQRQQQQQANEGFGLFGTSANSPRPQTPSSFHTAAQLADGRIGLPDLSIGQITIPNSSAMSPQHPSTPASVTSSSNFSHYGFAQYANSGHSRSGSSSTHPRSTSPAASVVSAATSLSSGSCPKSGRSRPPVSTGSTGCISMASFGSSPTDIATVKPKRRLQNRQRKEICQYFIEHPNSRQEDIASLWGVERSTVSKILKHKNRWMAVSDGDDQVIAKQRPPKFAEIERRMESWLVHCRDNSSLISDAMIRAKAREYAKELNIPEDKFKASAGWVENYKHRANIKKGIWIGRPIPPVHSDDECDLEELQGPFLYELVEEKRRADALKESDERRAQHGSEGLEQPNMGILGIELNRSPVTLNPVGEWEPSLGLTFDDNGSTNTLGLDNQMDGMNNVVGQQKDNQGSPHEKHSGPFSTEGSLLQQHFAAARASWAANSGAQPTNVVSGPLPVSSQEASSALDVVMRFLQTQRREFLGEHERGILTDIKHLLWLANQSASAAPSNSVSAMAGNNGVITTGAVGNTNNTGGGIASNGVSGGGELIQTPVA